MDIQKYVPVGKENAVPLKVIATGGVVLIGNGWVEGNTATELSMLVTDGAFAGSEWAVADTEIVALTIPPALER